MVVRQVADPGKRTLVAWVSLVINIFYEKICPREAGDN